MTQKTSQTSHQTSTFLPPLMISPTQILRGNNILSEAGKAIARLGQRPLIVGGNHTLTLVQPRLKGIFDRHNLVGSQGNYTPDCSENSLKSLTRLVEEHQADFIIGVGGGKALDISKLLADQCELPIVTIPTSGATCAAWSALSNIYSDEGAFLYDVPLSRCPDLLILDYDLIKTAPIRTLIAGIGDALAKWYEASVSSGSSTATLIISAVQQARILRDILLQKSASALQNPGGEDWREIVDATVLVAGVIGGLGGQIVVPSLPMPFIMD